MRGLTGILSQPVYRMIAVSLIHFLWQGTLVGVLLSAVNRVLRRSSAHSRYAAACAALAMMLTLPVVTAWRLQTKNELTETPA